MKHHKLSIKQFETKKDEVLKYCGWCSIKYFPKYKEVCIYDNEKPIFESFYGSRMHVPNWRFYPDEFKNMSVDSIIFKICGDQQ